MYVFEATLPRVALRGCMQREQPLPALARRSRARIEEQIGFRGEPQQRRTEDCFGLRRGSAAGRTILSGEDQLRYKQRIAEVRQRVVEALRGMNRAQGIEILLGIIADVH